MTGYRAAGAGILRATAFPRLGLPPWPDLSETTPAHCTAWARWLRQVLDVAGVAEAVELASPDFADAVRKMCTSAGSSIADTRRAVLTMIRYLLRMRGRSTPAGLMAGVAPVRFGAEFFLDWSEHHRVITSAGAAWLADVIAHLEACPGVLTRLPVITNTALMFRGDRVIIPYRAAQAGAADVSLQSSAPIRAALAAASAPVAVGDLAGKVLAEFPGADPVAVYGMLAGLVKCGALITSLHAPGTEADALAHLVTELEPASADAAGPLREIHELLQRHNGAPTGEAGQIRQEAVTRMRAVTQTRQHPLAADLRLDATLVLPDIVAHDAERAALMVDQAGRIPGGDTGLARLPSAVLRTVRARFPGARARHGQRQRDRLARRLPVYTST
jgi:hypothetical protein